MFIKMVFLNALLQEKKLHIQQPEGNVQWGKEYMMYRSQKVFSKHEQ